MNTSPDGHAIARIVVAKVTAGTENAHELAAAIERALSPVCQTTSSLIGNEGFKALIARALYLSTREHPLLSTLEIRADSQLTIKHTEVAVRSQGALAVTAAATALLGNIVTLLFNFIGEDLTMRLLQRTWSFEGGDPWNVPKETES